MRLGRQRRREAVTGVLRVRKLADRRDGERVVRFHPVTGERMLVRPETVARRGFDYLTLEREPWPLAGVVPLELPARCVVGNRFVEKAIAEGWARLEGERWAHRSGGPPDDPFKVTHSFRQGDRLVLEFLDGPVVYRIVRNPDKWPERTDGEAGHGGVVLWSYQLERDDG